MAYYVVDIIDIESPVDEELYEIDDGNYVLSEDEYPDPEKTYYIYEEDEEEDPDDDYEELDVSEGDVFEEDVYELISGEYVVSSDDEAQAGKTYYRYIGYEYSPPIDLDSLYYVYTDPVDDPSVEGLYEKGDDGLYFLTEDTQYDDEKVYYQAVEDVVKPEVDESPSDPYYSLSDLGVESIPEVPIASGNNMVYAWTRYVTDPSAKGFYEVVNGAYVLTQDTELVRGKTYYEHYVYNDYYEADMTGVNNPSFALYKYYELVNGSYVPTTDTTVSPLKAYYRSHTDDDNFYVPDPVRIARANAGSS